MANEIDPDCPRKKPWGEVINGTLKKIVSDSLPAFFKSVAKPAGYGVGAIVLIWLVGVALSNAFSPVADFFSNSFGWLGYLNPGNLSWFSGNEAEVADQAQTAVTTTSELPAECGSITGNSWYPAWATGCK